MPLRTTHKIIAPRVRGTPQWLRRPGSPPLPIRDRYTYQVRGQCEQDFDSISLARRYLARETEKFRNGKIRPFVATHTIYYRPAELGAVRRRIPVRVIDGACFQRREWEPCTRADFFWDVRNDYLVFQGMGLNWRWSIRPVELPEPSMTMLTEVEVARLDQEKPGAETLYGPGHDDPHNPG